MSLLRVFLLLAIGFGVSACGSKFKSYDGPPITSIQVHKEDRKMYLVSDGKIAAAYDIALGTNPIGHKQFEGDGKTPEGAYRISHKNPDSSYHLSLGISYPDNVDREYAAKLGKPPGGDIFIHGGPRGKIKNKDWTVGCIAVTDKEIEEIYAMVSENTPIYIFE